MKRTTKNEMAGKIHEAEGAVKETVEKPTNDPHPGVEDKVEGVVGKVQREIGQVRRAGMSLSLLNLKTD